MTRRATFASLAGIGAAACFGFSQVALGACRLYEIAHFRVSIANGQLTTTGQIDGKRARIGFDTGAQYSYVWRSGADRLGLPVDYLGGFRAYGVGGKAPPAQTLVKRLRIGNLHASGLRMFVLGRAGAAPPGAAELVLGDDVLLQYDLELDLGHRTIKLLHQKGCKTGQLAYWTRSYSEVALEHGSRLVVRVRLDGKPLDAYLDSGSVLSTVSRWAARRAGVKPWKKEPHPGRTITGVAGKPVPVWFGRFKSFSIGGETIRHVPLLIADLFGADTVVRLGSRIATPISNQADMLLGLDFLQAHHILVLPRRGKLLFTYEGGPVFRARQRRLQASSQRPGRQ